MLRSLSRASGTAQPALFKAISEGYLPVEALQRYGPESSYFLALHARSRGYHGAELALLEHASGLTDSSVWRLARREYLETSYELGDYKSLKLDEIPFAVRPDSSPEYVVAYGKILTARNQFGRLGEVLSEGRFESDEADVRASLLFLRLLSAYAQGDGKWRSLLLDLMRNYRAADLPEALFDEEFHPEIGKLWAELFNASDFTAAERSLCSAKRYYIQANYPEAFENYNQLFSSGENEVDGDSYLSKAVTDEFTLSALYSGNVRTAVSTVSEFRSKVEMRQSSSEERSLFWLLETEGYLRRKLGQFSRAHSLYEASLELSPSEERERIRWYIFDTRFRSNYLHAVQSLPEAVKSWGDDNYYNDVLFNLIDRLISNNQWELIAQTADALNGLVLNSAAARAGYLSARAAELGYFKASEEKIEYWYGMALSHSHGVGAGLYYRIMAACRLKEKGREVGFDPMDPALFCRNAPESSSLAINGATRGWNHVLENREAFPALIEAFLRYGLADEAYRRYGGSESSLADLSVTDIRRWAAALQEQGEYLESVRLFNRYCHSSDAPLELTPADIRLLYPEPYAEMVRDMCREYSLPEYLFYALVREESLFDADISSSAGAVGLSQLMPSTARDVASRIGVEIDDLTDPELNLRLGAWYLAHLMERTDSPSQALFSYNGGITRLRRWVSTYRGYPGDLLLEKIPFAETSHYGRKVLVSSVLYGYFYHGLKSCELVRQFFLD